MTEAITPQIELAGLIIVHDRTTPNVLYVDRTSENRERLPLDESVQSLFSITPEEKALAVPYVIIEHVDSKTNQKIGSTSFQFFDPPKFGDSTSVQRFRERPDVSLDSISIMSRNPVGVMMYREIQMTLSVHRSDSINDFSQKNPAETWSTLIRPGFVHRLRYGWRDGGKLEFGINYDKRKQPVQQSNKKRASSRGDIRFVVTSYNFSVETDGQVKIHVQAIEDGEVVARETSFLDILKQQTTERISLLDVKGRILSALNRNIVEISWKAEPAGTAEFVPLRNIVQLFIIDPLRAAFGENGYGRTSAVMGNFNDKCPQSSVKNGLEPYSGRPIGEYKVRYDTLMNLINGVFANGQQITINGLLQKIVHMLNDASAWDPDTFFPVERNGQIAVLPAVKPEIQIFTQFDPKTGIVQMHFFDLRTLVMSINPNGPSDYEQIAKQLSNMSTIDREKMLSSKLIPIISLGRSLSFIQSSKFEVTNDELMKSIYIERQLKPDRTQLTSRDPNSIAKDVAPPAFTMYRSAITGDIVMMGNFAFDVFSLFYLDLGVKLWNGFFWVLERTDKIENGNFTTVIKVRAEGSNPLSARLDPAQTSSIRRKRDDQSAIAPGVRRKGPDDAPPLPNTIKFDPRSDDQSAQDFLGSRDNETGYSNPQALPPRKKK